MDRKQIENYVFISLFVIPVLIFISTPTHPEDNITLQIDDFIDRYLLGNGWYSPSNYPFAAKVTNSFSVVWAVVTGSFMGIWRRNDIIPSLLPKNIGWILLVMVGLGAYMILMSFYPQEFNTSGGRRSFPFTESFHNSPPLFLAMIIVKEVCIYLPFRIIALVIYFFKGKK
ncbi:MULTISPECIES: hypothetical protein [unclassified Neisseria]|uniref:hypothetical protein n=1 Tax=unclassified Neisseria TaxID=2623750 RepID=UPI00107168A5|nr:MULTISPECIES: hypothetical protein [unclassified Neisseria]MBF0804975.1 hypothetical protein [Neisseria sp. 19428wB4_WF04]TFU39306.1 hypothetical protein E4T99_11795 [Neisseria sp. WF04]